ncbi:hypothetical protein [Thermosulfurimonas sp.]|uniref:hypothetical protein n=1 Tax=Thermosulfurimonas sp. TaxID=2080236 RepID=UPI0026015F8B|nr:hypothetical protein [Thermosulfurimonas sp.]
MVLSAEVSSGVAQKMYGAELNICPGEEGLSKGRKAQDQLSAIEGKSQSHIGGVFPDLIASLIFWRMDFSV